MNNTNDWHELSDEQKDVINRRNTESLLYDLDSEKEGFSDWLATFSRYAKEEFMEYQEAHFYTAQMIREWFEEFQEGVAFSAKACAAMYMDRTGHCL